MTILPQRHVKKLVRLAQALVLLSMTMVLFVALEQVVFPFVVTKIWIFQAFVAAAFGLYLIILLFDRKYLPKISVLSGAIAFFLVATLISSFSGVDSTRSLWSVHERMLGWFNVAHFAAFYVLIIGLFRTKKERMFLVMWFLLLSIPNSITVMIQKRVPGFLLSDSNRPVGLLGNAIYVSFFGVYVMSFALLVSRFCVEKFKASKQYATRLITYGWFSGIVVCAVAALLAGIATGLSNSRSAMLGLMAMLIWASIVVAIAASARRVRKKAIMFLLVVAMGVSVVVIGNKSPLLEKAPLVGRFANFSLMSGSNDNRLFAWEVGLKGFAERPWFGWGIYNYSSVFNKYYEGRRLQSDNYAETWFDNAHNFYIDTLVTGGIIGLLGYLSMYVAALYLCYWGWKKNRLSFFETTLLSSLVVFHAVQNIFVFEHIVSYLSFFLLLAFIAGGTGKVRNYRRGEINVFVVVLAAVLVVISTGFVIYRANIVQYQANRYMYTGLHTLYATGKAGLWFSDFNKALALPTPHRAHIIEEMARSILGANIPPELVNDRLREMGGYIIKELENNTAEHEYDVINRMMLAEMWFFMGRLFPNEYPDAFELGDQYFTAAIAQSPQRQQLLINWASHLARIGMWDKSRDVMLRARSFSPKVGVVAEAYQAYLERTNQKMTALRHKAVLLDFHRGSFKEYEENAIDYHNFVDKEKGARRLANFIACTDQIVPAQCPPVQRREVMVIVPRVETFDIVINYYKQLDPENLEPFQSAKLFYYPAEESHES